MLSKAYKLENYDFKNKFEISKNNFYFPEL